MIVDAVRYAERQEAIGKLMACVRFKQMTLIKRINLGDADMAGAIQRNQRMPGILGELWNKFLHLDSPAQVEALTGAEYEGMSWQSLLQCSPFFQTNEA